MMDETQEAILDIKLAVPEGQIVRGIDLTMAVIQDGIRTYGDSVRWQESQRHTEIID